MTLRLLSNWHPAWAMLLAVGLAGLAWFLYWQETSRAVDRYYRWLLPSLRATAIGLIVLTLCEPVLESQFREGEPGKITFLIDESESMSIADDRSDASPGGTRYARSLDALWSDARGVVPQLASTFDVEICHVGDEGVAALWSTPATLDPLTQDEWSKTISRDPGWSSSTPLGDALVRLADGVTSTGAQEQVFVILTDGQSNAGLSLPEAAEKMKRSNLKVFSVGVGGTDALPDLVMRSSSVPSQVFLESQVAGVAYVGESVAVGERYSVCVAYDGVELWRQDLVAEGKVVRNVDFTFPARAIYEAATAKLPAGSQFTTLPAKLDIEVQLERPEANTANNSAPAYLAVVAQPASVLLADGRSRWETRYLKNMFERDPAWNLTTVLERAGTLPNFPKSQAELFDFNLVILGDLDAQLLTPAQLGWIKEYVSVGGGGLILIDGQRGHLQSDAYMILHQIAPVRWDEGSSRSGFTLPSKMAVTSAGSKQEALRLADTEADSERLWMQLPDIDFVARVEPVTGSEVLATAETQVEKRPLIVGRRFGAGRVLYVATDESWKWRFKIADEIHTRLWNQLARWQMRSPFSIESDFLSLDTGAASYQVGETVAIRCKLRSADGGPAESESVNALVYQGEELISRVTMDANVDVPGDFSGGVGNLASGDYRVRIEAAGFSSDALDLVSKFTMVEPPNQEMLRTHCDADSLRQLSELTGGEYLHEDELDQLVERLRPLSGGRVVRSATILWQSYWWFSAAVLLLVIEWILRKKAGLV